VVVRLGVWGGFVWLAGPAGDAAVVLGRLLRHDLQIIRTEEPDEDALAAVIPGNARHHRDIHIRADGRCLFRRLTSLTKATGATGWRFRGVRLCIVNIFVSYASAGTLSWINFRC
jgi:hypothetical protein